MTDTRPDLRAAIAAHLQAAEQAASEREPSPAEQALAEQGRRLREQEGQA